MTYSSDERPEAMDDLLSALTDAIIADDAAIDGIVTRYGVPRGDVEPFIHLVRRLHVALVGVRPSRRFVRRLQTELLGQQRIGVIGRIRYLPPRVQIAAMVAVVAGFMLISRRRIAFDARKAAASLAAESPVN
jgi:hypothetical protein